MACVCRAAKAWIRMDMLFHVQAGKKKPHRGEGRIIGGVRPVLRGALKWIIAMGVPPTGQD